MFTIFRRGDGTSETRTISQGVGGTTLYFSYTFNGTGTYEQRGTILETGSYVIAATVALPRSAPVGPVLLPSYQDANYWTCEATYQVIAPKNSAGPRTLRIEWGDGVSSDYAIPQSSGLGDAFATIEAKHIFESGVARTYYQRAYVVGDASPNPNGYSVAVTTHQASQYDTRVSGSIPLIYPAVQAARPGIRTYWTVVAPRNPDRDRWLVFRPDAPNSSSDAMVLIPKGVGSVVLSFSHVFSSGCPSACASGRVQQAFFADTLTDVVPYSDPPFQLRGYSFTYCSGC